MADCGMKTNSLRTIILLQDKCMSAFTLPCSTQAKQSVKGRQVGS